MKKTLLLLAVTILGFTGTVTAAPILVGSLDIAENGTQYASFTASSLTLNVKNLVVNTDGDFVSLVPLFSGVTAGPASTAHPTQSTKTITGLTVVQLPKVISNLLVFASAGPPGGGGGTNPVNRFSFQLLTLSDSGANLALNGGVFLGTGIITDSLNVYAPTKTEFDLAFTSAKNYTITLTAGPEPATWALLLGGLCVLGFFARRKALLAR